MDSSKQAAFAAAHWPSRESRRARMPQIAWKFLLAFAPFWITSDPKGEAETMRNVNLRTWLFGTDTGKLLRGGSMGVVVTRNIPPIQSRPRNPEGRMPDEVK
jgi:hypothetical protein